MILCKLINSYYEVRDEFRRRYIAKDPNQPHDQKFSQNNSDKLRRSFQKKWYKKFCWLEYNVNKYARFCFCFYFFDKGRKNGDDVFTEVGFRN